MRLTKFQCRRFRCLENITFEPASGLNVIRGGNAQGKTSILEAILFAATSKSHRTNIEAHLPQNGGDEFHIHAWARRQDRDVDIEANWWRGAKRFKVNGVAQTRVSDILGRINVVFFSPEDVGLIKEGAGRRRRFLDMELSQINPAYLSALQQYRQVLRQRNELLRAQRPDEDVLSVWDAQLAKHGEAIMAERAAFVAELSALAAAAYEGIAGQSAMEVLSLEFKPNVSEAGALESELKASRAKDLKYRQTHCGPHRDDLDIFIGGQPARTHASQGQQKSAALALKLAELELVRERTGEFPVLMLDEVLAELDERRSERLFAAIDAEVQCIVTTTDIATRRGVPQSAGVEFHIERGRLEKR